MASNLVSYVMQMLTPDVIGRIAAALGLDSGKVQSAVGAAVPAVLAGLGSIAAQPGGAQKIADAAKQQSGSLGNLAGMLAAGGPESLAQSGSHLLEHLLFRFRIQHALAFDRTIGSAGHNDIYARSDFHDAMHEAFDRLNL